MMRISPSPPRKLGQQRHTQQRLLLMLEALSTGQPGDRTLIQHPCHVFVTFPYLILALTVGHGPLFPAHNPLMRLRV